MHSRVAIRKTEDSDGSQQQEQGAEREENDAGDIHCFSPLRDPLQVKVLREGECADEIDEGIDKSDIDEELDSFEDGPYQEDERDRLCSDDIDGDDSVYDSWSPQRPVET